MAKKERQPSCPHGAYILLGTVDIRFIISYKYVITIMMMAMKKKSASNQNINTYLATTDLSS